MWFKNTKIMDYFNYFKNNSKKTHLKFGDKKLYLQICIRKN